MKNAILITSFLFISIFAFAQTSNEKGIQFEKNSSWEQIVTKAQKENKHIFVDCFTTWCGPCKMLDKGAFASEKAGEFFTKNLVAFKLQMDRTPKDEESVMNNYGLSEKFEKDYFVRAYPTMLIFNPKGELVHRIVGGGNIEDTQLIEQINAGLNPETQSSNLKKRYEKGEKSPAFLKLFVNFLIQSFDDNILTAKVCKEYLATQSNWSLEENQQFVIYVAWKKDSKEFDYVKNHEKDFESYLKMNYNMNAKRFISDVKRNDCFNKSLDAKTQKIDNVKLETNLKKEFGEEETKLIILKYKIYGFQNEKTFNAEYVSLVNQLMSLDKDISAVELNQYAWIFFEKSDDKELLKQALKWAIMSVEKSSEPYNNDTVANLLFKIGDDMNLAKTYAEKTIFLSDQSKGDTVDIKALLVKINARLGK